MSDLHLLQKLVDPPLDTERTRGDIHTAVKEHIGKIRFDVRNSIARSAANGCSVLLVKIA